MQTSPVHGANPSERKDLRLWPGVAAICVQWLCWFALPLAVPGPVTGVISAAGGLAGGLAVAVWWACLSRAPRPERLGFIALAPLNELVVRWGSELVRRAKGKLPMRLGGGIHSFVALAPGEG